MRASTSLTPPEDPRRAPFAGRARLSVLPVSLLALLVLLAVVGCEVTFTGGGPRASVSPSLASRIPPASVVVVLDPLVLCEWVEGVRIAEPWPKVLADCPGERSLAGEIGEAARAALRAGGANVLGRAEIGARSPEALSSFEALCADIPDLLRGFRPEPTARLMQRLAGQIPNIVLLVPRCTVTVGMHSGVDPVLGGNQPSSLRRTVLQAALLQPTDGQTLWHKEVLLHDLPDAARRNYQPSLELLFRP